MDSRCPRRHLASFWQGIEHGDIIATKVIHDAARRTGRAIGSLGGGEGAEERVAEDVGVTAGVGDVMMMMAAMVEAGGRRPCSRLIRSSPPPPSSAVARLLPSLRHRRLKRVRSSSSSAARRTRRSRPAGRRLLAALQQAHQIHRHRHPRLLSPACCRRCAIGASRGLAALPSASRPALDDWHSDTGEIRMF